MIDYKFLGEFLKALLNEIYPAQVVVAICRIKGIDTTALSAQFGYSSYYDFIHDLNSNNFLQQRQIAEFLDVPVDFIFRDQEVEQ